MYGLDKYLIALKTRFPEVHQMRDFILNNHGDYINKDGVHYNCIMGLLEEQKETPEDIEEYIKLSFSFNNYPIYTDMRKENTSWNILEKSFPLLENREIQNGVYTINMHYTIRNKKTTYSGSLSIGLFQFALNHPQFVDDDVLIDIVADRFQKGSRNPVKVAKYEEILKKSGAMNDELELLLRMLGGNWIAEVHSNIFL